MRVVVCYLGVYAGANPFGQFRIEVDAAEGFLVTRPHAQSVLAQCAARQVVPNGRCAARYRHVGRVHGCRLVHILIPLEVGFLEILAL